MPADTREYPTSNLGNATKYEFMTAARWRPCTQPITWHDNLTDDLLAYGGAPANERSLIAGAFTSLTRHTGYQFTRVSNAANADITITGVNSLPGTTIGEGGFTYAGSDVVKGHVTVDLQQMATATGAQRFEVYAHELGHVFTLGHVDDNRQTMYPSVEATNLAWGAGDVAGLRALPAYSAC